MRPQSIEKPFSPVDDVRFHRLFITTNLVLVIHYLHEFGVDIQDTPFLFHPVKLLGNIGTLAAFAGVFLIVRDRMRETNSVLTLFDWIFIVILLTVFSGIMSGFWVWQIWQNSFSLSCI